MKSIMQTRKERGSRWIRGVVLCLMLVFFCLSFSSLTSFAAAGIWKGNGTEQTPYLIEDIADLEELASCVNSGNTYEGQYFWLMADIDLSEKYGENTGVSWTPIGNTENPFEGFFDGKGHEIKNIYINALSDYQGLFGTIGKNGVIKNIGLSGGTVNGVGYIGSIAGQNHGTIENCYNTAMITGSAGTVGGIVGESDGIVRNCYNTGAVSGKDYIGGIVGKTYIGANCIIENSYYLDTSAVGGMNGIDIEGQTVAKTEKEFSNGTVAFLLNKGKTDGTQVWYQNLDNDKIKDAVPKLTGGTVFKRDVYFCEHRTDIKDTLYSNVQKADEYFGTLKYKAEKNVITQICEGCDHNATVTISVSDSTYDATEKKNAQISYSELWKGNKDAQITYLGDLLNAGKVTAQITIGDQTAEAAYEIKKAVPTAEDFVISGSMSETYDGMRKAVTMTAGNGIIGMGVVTGIQYSADGGVTWTDVPKNVGNYQIRVIVAEGSNYLGASLSDESWVLSIQPALLTVKAENKTKLYGEAEPEYSWIITNGNLAANDVLSGISVSRASGENVGKYAIAVTQDEGANPNYSITFENGELEITGAPQNPPSVKAVKEEVYGKENGKITEVTPDMEYRAEGETVYRTISGTEITELKAGTYYVRYKALGNYLASEDTTVKVEAGAKLSVKVPSSQEGYTLKADQTELSWNGSTKLRFKLSEGYSDDDLKITATGAKLTSNGNGVYTISNATANVVVSVSGVKDETAPTGTIQIGKNKWKSFSDDITFKIYFSEKQSVTITAADKGSGVKAIAYYLSDEELTKTEVKNIDDWKTYSKAFQINPDEQYVVYVKITDKAGNTTYINSNGVVLDETPPAISGVENGKNYFEDTSFKVKDSFSGINTVTVDGKSVKLSSGEYTIDVDNKTHTIVATDLAGNKVEYKIGVYKTYTVTYVLDDEVYHVEEVGYGEDATAPAVPEKDGYTATWDKDGKAIKSDTEIHAVYTEVPRVSPKTGDGSQMLLWCLVLIGSVTGLAIVTTEHKKIKKL
ncbi:MAG: hypothetical protein IJ024_07355 [Lachnospiraceae bacterium]|nr:hypothetical protein [Lachnospiraceae bacterium]